MQSNLSDFSAVLGEFPNTLNVCLNWFGYTLHVGAGPFRNIVSDFLIWFLASIVFGKHVFNVLKVFIIPACDQRAWPLNNLA